MCGIVGYVGEKEAQSVIYNGLQKLEYRGYDSAGIAILQEDGQVDIRRDAGKLINLGNKLKDAPLFGKQGIGHTRWATHGAATSGNAHPHKAMNGRVVLVQNGIMENFAEIKEELMAEGVTFESETDTEVIVQLLGALMDGGMNLESAVRETLSRLKGSNAIVVMSPDNPGELFCARLGNAGGIAVGIGEDEMFLASDIPAILEHTRKMIFLENGQMAKLTADTYSITDLQGNPVDTEIHTIPFDPVSAERGEYRHFMQKEIFEQPRALIDTMRGRVDFENGTIELPQMNLTPELVQKINKIYAIGCGTSYYAGLVGKFLFENIARLPTEVEYGSEFRYYDPIVDENTAVLALTQSGETADTLAASAQAVDQGATLWSIVNAIGSQATRVADGHILMQAGPEIGVASTKAFTTAIVDQYLLACKLGEMRGTLSPERMKQLVKDLMHLPDMVGRVLDQNDAIDELAAKFSKAEHFLFLGRGVNYPIALEGALKLKEISYIHAEGYPAGEMKHGPIALIDETMPVLAIATKDFLYEKMISQVQQAKARGGILIAVATEGDTAIANEVDEVIYVPEASELLAPLVNVVALQLLSYHIAVRRGCDVDMPRNLAKSVTVE